MERLILLADRRESAHAVVDTLRDQGIDDAHLHVIASDGTALDDLPEASLTETTDVLPAATRGVAIGATSGMLLGLATAVIAPAGLVVGGGAVVAGTLGGASFGAFASALIGSSVPNSQIDEYAKHVEQGSILVIAEVDESRVDELRKHLTDAHADVEVKGLKDWPATPA